MTGSAPESRIFLGWTGQRDADLHLGGVEPDAGLEKPDHGCDATGEPADGSGDLN